MPSSEEHVMKSEPQKNPKSIITPSSSSFVSRLSVLLIFLLIAVQQPQQSCQAKAELPTCSRYQACIVEIVHYPLLPATTPEGIGSMVALEPTSTTTEREGSGEEGSGEELEFREVPTTFPFYDEQVEAQTSVFDYQADGDMSTKQICRCPNEDDDSTVECGFSSQEHIMEVDKSVRLSFCKPIKGISLWVLAEFRRRPAPGSSSLSDLFPKCRSQRGLMRIIGEVDTKSGETISSVNDTVVFCRCASALRRDSIEPWMGKYAFNYRCEWSPIGTVNPDVENKSL